MNKTYPNGYQEAAATTAIYPRVYTEEQIRLIIADVLNQLERTTEGEHAVISESLDFWETPFNRLVYPVLGLVGEAGEIANKLKKVARDNQGQMDLDQSEAIEEEVGDVLWYVAAITTELKVKLGDVAKKNLEKLFSRKDRGALGGSGDRR
jgi:NTP pyrophosphatase (non-canonical NTP hydrolase)